MIARKGGAWLIATWLVAICAPAVGQDAGVHGTARPPNVVILLADDLGYGDLGIQGATDVATPNIDRLASDGVRLTSFYANHPVCSPSRAALLTGKYQHRFGFENNSGSPENTSPKFGIPLSEKTLAERLKPLGYATAMFGKWHVGFRQELQPTSRGFDAFYGFLAGANAFVPGRRGGERMMRGTQPVPMPAHTTEAFADEAVRFIDSNRDRPFLLYVPFNAVHAPLQTTEHWRARFATVADEKRRTYLGMLAAMDDAVGRILQAVERNGLAGQTLVVFSSDNGGPTWQTTSHNGPLNGFKATVLEGGIRVPTIVRWTGRLPAGRTVDFPAMGFDIPVTAMAAAGLPADAGLDGVNLLPLLAGQTQPQPDRALFWRAGQQGAMRKGDWKLVKAEDRFLLFNLAADIGERKDLAIAEPERVAAMMAEWSTWSGQMAKPAWVRNEVVGGDKPRPPGALRNLIEQMVAGNTAAAERLLDGGGGARD